MDKIWYNIYKEIGKELGIALSVNEIEDIFASQFKFIRHTNSQIDIHEENLPTIYIPELGRFYGKRKKTKILRKSKITKELNKIQNGSKDTTE